MPDENSAVDPEVQSTGPRSFASWLDEHGGRALPNDDLVHMFVPLFRTIARLHQDGKIAAPNPETVDELADGSLALCASEGQQLEYNNGELRRIQPHKVSALKVVGEYRITTDTESGQTIDDASVAADGSDAMVTKPIYLAGYRSWEHHIGHADEIGDVFLVGMLLASVACGLDFREHDDLHDFAKSRDNLFRFNGSLNPVIAQLIGEMTELNRHERATDIGALADRLENYREQPVGLSLGRVLDDADGIRGRQAAVLAHLRDRLFDLSRRNKLIHFRPTQSSVNLTQASVPLVMRFEAIRPDQLCTWDGAFRKAILSGKVQSLNQWLRFEDQPYIKNAFNKLLQEMRRDRAELGFSQLRLVIAFLHWHNLKDAPQDRLTSPLLWLPVELSKRKGVQDQFVLQCPEPEAEINPALRHHLDQLYGITLPEKLNLAEGSVEELHASIAAQIQLSEKRVALELRRKPVIRLIHQKAVQRMRQFERRRRAVRSASGLVRPDFSYDSDDLRPLGLALFEKYVKPSPLPQRLAAGGSTGRDAAYMAPPGAKETERATYSLDDGSGHQFAWDIDLTRITLANFNYQKMSLVRDYNELIASEGDLPSFNQIFSIDPKPIDEARPEPLSPGDRWNVVPADSTQDAAVALARSGRSFIIQGPPGTGKSQTITNLIADFAGRGKRVLFVCEKRAALDVVFHRLGQTGLEKLSCIIHDSQQDKKAFVHDLKQSYESWTREHDGIEARQAERNQLISTLDDLIELLQSFEDDMSAIPGNEDLNLRDLLRRAASLPMPAEDFDPRLRERLPPASKWDSHQALVRKTQRFATEEFGLEAIAEHPFAKLARTAVEDEKSYARVDDLVVELADVTGRIEAMTRPGESPLSLDMTLTAARAMAAKAHEAIDIGLANSPGLVEPGSEASQRLADLEKELDAARSVQTASEQDAAAWHEPLSPTDTDAALEQARRQEPSFFKFLSGAWRRLRRTVEERYDFASHAVKPTVTHVLELLDVAQDARAAVETRKNEGASQFGTSDLDGLIAFRDALGADAASDAAVGDLLDAVRSASDGRAVFRNAAAALSDIERLTALLELNVRQPMGMTLEEIESLARDMRESMDELPQIITLLQDIYGADPEITDTLLDLAYPSDALEAVIFDEAIARFLRAHPEIRRIDVDRILAATRNADRALGLLRNSNAETIKAVKHNAFRDHVKRSMQSLGQLDAAGKAFKKSYASGRRDLEHEFGKVMRYRSIRDLADGDTGRVVNDLKPIWLMSPLSVSDTLPLDGDLFDVVIFDEASQIPTEDAVPAICRAPQLIVVGDEMQLPPTSFFSAAQNADDMQVTVEEDGEQIAILLDSDSLLSQASQNLPATLLAWHYRSRFEALIGFSNAAFYDGRLVTIPDRQIAQSASDLVPLSSVEEGSAKSGGDRLLDRAISTHKIEDGVYVNRANEPEARYVARLARELLQRETGLSIGIVAFSEAQQSAIEDALESLAEEDSDFASRLDAEYVREDDGQFNGLFVKNLENVQGDERDIIILSICYAPGPNGRMAMNFGPINQRGGEKRLNVIFSRARQHMAVITTIEPEAITNTHNDGARSLRGFLSYANAQSRGDPERSTEILATLNPDSSDALSGGLAEDSVRDAIAGALVARGHHVDVLVGSAGFKCDVAIRSADGDHYVLGLLLDRGTGSENSDVASRYVFRPAILRAFGWRVLVVPGHQWREDRDGLIERIEAELGRDSWALIGDELPLAKPAVVAADRPAAEELGDDGLEDLSSAPSGMQEFRFQKGRSNKFWKIGIEGNDVIVAFGRIGTKGQTTIKTFDGAEAAEREMNKLIREKERKGYIEFDTSR